MAASCHVIREPTSCNWQFTSRQLIWFILPWAKLFRPDGGGLTYTPFFLAKNRPDDHLAFPAYTIFGDLIRKRGYHRRFGVWVFFVIQFLDHWQLGKNHIMFIDVYLLRIIIDASSLNFPSQCLNVKMDIFQALGYHLLTQAVFRLSTAVLIFLILLFYSISVASKHNPNLSGTRTDLALCTSGYHILTWPYVFSYTTAGISDNYNFHKRYFFYSLTGRHVEVLGGFPIFTA